MRLTRNSLFAFMLTSPAMSSPLSDATILKTTDGYSIPVAAQEYMNAADRLWTYGSYSNVKNPICGHMPADIDDEMWSLDDEITTWLRSFETDASMVVGFERGRIRSVQHDLLHAGNKIACDILSKDLDTLGLRDDWVGARKDPQGPQSFIDADDFEELKMLAAIDNTDCNWDDSARDNVQKYSSLYRYQNIDTDDAWWARYDAITSQYEDTMATAAALNEASDAGADFGLDNLDQNCPIIEEFAADFLVRMK
jgi:hypothetical protein